MVRTGGINNSKEKNNKVIKDTKSNKKIVIKNKKKFTIVISVIVFLVVIIILLLLNNKKDLAKVDDYSKLNAKKYSDELLEEYNKEEGKDKFLEDYDFIQGAVGMYIMNNSTNEEESFSNIITQLKEELKRDTWGKLDYEKPTFWNGEYSVDDNGIVKFKFGNKSIEPRWINDDELNGKIILN